MQFSQNLLCQQWIAMHVLVLYELTCVLKFIYSIRVSIVLDCILYRSLNWCTCSCECFAIYSLIPSTHLTFCCLQYGKLGVPGNEAKCWHGFWLYMNLFCKGFWLTLIIIKWLLSHQLSYHFLKHSVTRQVDNNAISWPCGCSLFIILQTCSIQEEAFRVSDYPWYSESSTICPEHTVLIRLCITEVYKGVSWLLWQRLYNMYSSLQVPANHCV